MRISDLSKATGVSAPTIKFYVRDGLLTRGLPTARNQAQYSEDHVHEIRLIRAMADFGGLNIDQIKEVFGFLRCGDADSAMYSAETPHTVDDILAVAEKLGVGDLREHVHEYEACARILGKIDAEVTTPDDPVSSFVAALLGDALIKALRHQLRRQT